MPQSFKENFHELYQVLQKVTVYEETRYMLKPSSAVRHLAEVWSYRLFRKYTQAFCDYLVSACGQRRDKLLPIYKLHILKRHRLNLP